MRTACGVIKSTTARRASHVATDSNRGVAGLQLSLLLA